MKQIARWYLKIVEEVLALYRGELTYTDIIHMEYRRLHEMRSMRRERLEQEANASTLPDPTRKG